MNTVGLVAFIALTAMVIAVTATIEVSDARIRRFANKHALTITPDNGEIVIRYLGTTRRWRLGCLIAIGAIVIGVRFASQDALRASTGELFLGWFVGAVIAEWRVSRLPAGARPSASLQRRRSDDYIHPALRALPVVLALIVSSGWVGTVLDGLTFDRHDRSAVAGLAALTCAAVCHAVAVRVLRRPQPVAAADVLAADDAVRSRSLHAVHGAGVTLTTGCLAWQWQAMAGAVDSPVRDSALASASLAVGMAGVVAGWLIAHHARQAPVAEPAVA